MTVSKADSVTCNGPWHNPTLAGVRDYFPDSLDYLGGGLLARDLAPVAAALLASAGLMSLIVHVFCLLCLLCLLSEK